MTSYNYSLLFLFGLFLTTGASWAQSVCPKDFSKISSQCLSKSSLKFDENASLGVNNGLRGDILFFQMASGETGKLKVVSTLTSKEECTFYLDAVTYTGDKVFIPNSSISIQRSNNWLKERIYLDRDGAYALELEMISDQQIARRNAERLIEEQKLNKQESTKINEEAINAKSSVKSCRVLFTSGVKVARFYDHNSEDDELWTESYNILYYAPAILIFIAIFLIVRVFMEEQDKFKTQEALEDAENTAKVKNQAFFIKITRPFYKRYFLPMTQGKNKQKYRSKYRQKLANAGISKDMSPEEFMALKFFMILGGPFGFLTVRFIMEENWPLTITPVMGLIGYYYPDVWLSGLIKNRANDILRAMPFIIDMLALSVEAGLDFMAAIQRVIEKAPPSPLNEEFETLIRETKIGSSRAEGLRQLGWRVNIIEINSFCATLIAADSVGASIGPLLKQLSSELRVKRSARAEQAGATAATKILIPMIFFILPAVLVAIFAPMVLKMMSGKL